VLLDGPTKVLAMDEGRELRPITQLSTARDERGQKATQEG
jgi:hypothetical protein